MPGPFAPTISANVAYESPVAPVKPAPTFLEGALGIAETGLKMYAQEQKAAKTRAGRPDPNLKLFSEEMDKVAQIRSSQGEMAGRLAERNVASNFAAAGIDLDKSYKAVYETKTGRSFEAYGRDDEAAFREALLKDESVQANLTASLSILPPDASFEERLEFAVGEKARVESSALLVGRAKVDATTNWSQAEGGYNTITDSFLSTSMGALVQREQNGVPITAQDIANLKVQWTQLKAGTLSRPSYLGDDQWKSFSSRLDQVDKMFVALEKASSNDVLRDSMTKYLADAINRSEGIEPTQKAVAVLGALSGDAAILSQLGGRFGDVAEAMSKAKVIELPSANIFGQSLFAPGKPAPGPNSAVTKDDLPPEIAQKYSNMSAPDRVNQMKADGTYSSLFSSASMGNPENREAFAQRAMSLGTTMLSGGTDEFLSSQFLRQGVANPKFISSIKALELQDADLGMKTKTIVRSGLLTEKLRQNANLGSVENRIQGANFNEQTGRYEIDAEFFRRKEDLAAFNADLNEFYGGDLAVAARDNFNKIEAKYTGFRVSGANATNVIRLGKLNAIPEALKRRDAITVIDQGIDQLTDPTEDILAPITEPSGEPVQEPVMGQGATPPAPVAAEPESEDRSILQRIGEFFLGSPAAAAELPPELRDLALSYARQGRPEELSSDPAVVSDNPAYESLISAGVNANELQGIIMGESKGDPQAQNRSTKASGLFQFTPTAAKELGTTVTKIRNMNPKEQADLYLKYLNRWGWKPGVPLGLMQAAPSLARNWDERSRDDVVYRKDSAAWKANPAWRPEDDGDITIGSIEDYYASEAPPPLPPRRPEVTSDAQFVSEISKALAETPTERRVREAQARQAAKEAYYRSLNQ